MFNSILNAATFSVGCASNATISGDLNAIVACGCCGTSVEISSYVIFHSLDA